MPKEYKVIHADQEPARVAAEATRLANTDRELVQIIETPHLGPGREWTGLLERDRPSRP